MRDWRAIGVVGALASAGMLAGCAGDGRSPAGINVKPAFVGAIARTVYDGASDDLLTGGLGKTGLGAAAAPAPATPAAPTAAELRRNAIFTNYRSILDISPKGGYGVLYGPNIDVAGNDTLGEGKIAGTEYLAYADDGTGKKNVTMMVQVPSSFNQIRPCIVTAASSGSRGVYGAIGSAGEWGLKHDCAVAYTDKGTGMGTHDLASNTVNLQDGTRADAAAAGTKSSFTAALSGAELAQFNSAYPNRAAFKHAHSQQNPEKDWGNDTLNAIRFAFYVLNEQFAPKGADGSTTVKFRADNTIVIASSVSNGGASAIAAAEQDTEGLIDGVAVSEPVLEQAPNPGLVVRQGNKVMNGSGKALLDYYTLANLYQPCATLSKRAVGSPGLPAILPNAGIATNRCTALKAKGLLKTATAAEQAEESMDTLQDFGYLPESNVLHASHYPFGISPVVVTFASGYGKFGVAERLCGYSFAPTDAAGKPSAIAAAQLAQVFANGNGIPPTATLNIVNDNNPGGPLLTGISVSPSTGRQDFNFDGALCHRNLLSDSDANADRVQSGIKEVLRQCEPARQARADRRRTRGHPGARPVQRASLFRPEQDRRRRGEQARLHRSAERPAFRRLHRQRCLPRLRRALRSAALLFHPGHGPDVGASHTERPIAAVAGGARHATRWRRGFGASDREDEPSADRLGSGHGGPHHVLGRDGHDSRLTFTRDPREQVLPTHPAGDIR